MWALTRISWPKAKGYQGRSGPALDKITAQLPLPRIKTVLSAMLRKAGCTGGMKESR